MKVAIIGATGFTGEKLAELLCRHSSVKISYLSAIVPAARAYGDLFPKFHKNIALPCEPLDVDKALKRADFFFLALPHLVSMEIVPRLLEKGKKVVDLSADYRIQDPQVYKKWYGKAHKDKKNLDNAVYGLPEFFKNKIKKAVLVANPGCYSTSAILAIAPLLNEKIINPTIIVDAKSSITGAGRKASLEYHYAHVVDNIWAYKPFIHQHTPEIVQVLEGISGTQAVINFVPHVVGIEGGIYSTLYVTFRRQMSFKKVAQAYGKWYKKSFFVRFTGSTLPRLRDVVGTNFCDIGCALTDDRRGAVIASTIDNLIKGAAGTAVHNMNIMCGFSETDGLL